MAGGTLQYRIELDSAEAQAALQGLQSAGSDLFRTLEQASASLTRGGGFAAFATTIAAAGAAVVGITGSLFAMAKASSETVDELGELAAQVGSSVEEISTLRSALVQLEANGETLQRAFQRMGNTIQEVWPAIQKSINGAANQITGDQLDVEKATLSLAKAQIEAAASSDMVARAYLGVQQAAIALQQAQQKVAESTDTEQQNHLDLERALLNQKQIQTELARLSQDAAQQQIDSTLNIANAIQSVTDAEVALRQAKGETISKEEQRQNAIKRAELALQAARERRAEAEAKAAREQEDLELRRQQIVLQRAAADRAVADAQKKQALEAQQQQLVLLQLEQAKLNLSDAKKKASEAELQSASNLVSVHEAELKLNQAREKQRQNELNSIDSLAARINALAAGTAKGMGGISTSVEDVIKGLVASVGPGVTALEGLGGSFGEVTQRAPQMVPVLLKLADVFKNMEDGALKLAIATKLFGRKDAVDMVESLSEGSAAIQQRIDKMKALGLVISDTEGASKRFIAAQNTFQDAIRIIGTQLGQLFTPAFAAAMEQITAAIGKSQKKILEWGAAIRDTVVPILESFVRVLLGIPQAGKDDWLVGYINNIKAFGTAVTNVINTIIIPAFTALVAATGGIAKAINLAFGTELNAFDVLLGAWILKILGAFRLLATINLASLGAALNSVLVAVGFLGRAVMALPGVLVTIGLAFETLAIAAVAAIRTILVALGPWGIAIVVITTAIGLLIQFWPQIQAAAEPVLAWINANMVTAGLAVAAFGTALAALILIFPMLGTAAVTAIGTILTALGPVGIAIAAIGIAIGLLILYWPQLQEAAEVAWNAILTAATRTLEFIRDWVVTPVADAWKWITTTFDDAVNWVMRKARELIDWLANLFTGSPEMGGVGSEGSVGAFAHGGRVGGRGTGTSDSNLAWVSRGEHIMPARAVRQPGVLAFLEALRRSGGNLSRVLDGMGRFALGGMVPAMPAFAGGGPSGGMSNVTIQFPGLPAISGLRASSEVVDELRKAAALAQVRSGGRKPSRYS